MGRRRWRRWLIPLSALVLVSSGSAIGVATATPVGACFFIGDQGYYLWNGVYIRNGPSTSHTALGEGYESQFTTWHYQVAGQYINGDPYWDYNTDQSTGITGYSSDYYYEITYTPEYEC